MCKAEETAKKERAVRDGKSKERCEYCRGCSYFKCGKKKAVKINRSCQSPSDYWVFAVFYNTASSKCANSKTRQTKQITFNQPQTQTSYGDSCGKTIKLFFSFSKRSCMIIAAARTYTYIQPDRMNMNPPKTNMRSFRRLPLKSSLFLMLFSITWSRKHMKWKPNL